MSSLILPNWKPHWRPDWSALMSVLKLTSGHLTHTATEHLAFCDDCLCDIPIVYGSCDCIEEDFGTVLSIGSAEVVITGSLSPYAASSPFCAAPASCASLNGTYIMSCAAPVNTWCISNFVCNSGGNDYFYIQSVKITYSPTTPSLVVVIGSFKGVAFGGGSNPYPTLSSGCTQAVFGQMRTLSWVRSTTPSSYSTWQYEMSEPCRESCNETTTLRKCPTDTGALTWDSDSSTLIGTGATADHCELSGLTITATVAAAA